MWQDVVLSFIGIGFGLALIPAFCERWNIKLKWELGVKQSALITATLLAIMGYTYLTLGLVLSTILLIPTILMWLLIAYPKPELLDRFK